MKKRKVAKKINSKKSDIKRALPFRLLMVSLFALVLLIILYSNVPKKEIKGLGGELGALKWDFSKENMVLEVLNYTKTNNNLTMEVNISWVSGNQNDFRGIFVDFIKAGGNCNSTLSVLMSYQTTKIYTINIGDTNCGENFTAVTSVDAYAQIFVHLTQIKPLENITVYNDDSLTDVLDLDDYFDYYLAEVSYSAVGDPGSRIGLTINSTTHKIRFDPKLDRYGIYMFNLTASSNESKILSVSTNGKNMSFYVTFINENRPGPNEAPEFLDDECEDFTIDLNQSINLKFDMKNCFNDSDGDSLTFRYDNSSFRNFTVVRDNNNLTLTPNSGFLGTRYLMIYANDSVIETGGRINIEVINRTSTAGINQSANQTIPKIKTINLAEGEVSIFVNGSKNFIITAENYDSIGWYLNGRLVKSNSLSYNPGNLSEGNYTIKVEIKKGNQVDSRIWELIVIDDETGTNKVFDAGSVIFYAIIVVVFIIIVLVIWLLIAHKNSKNKNQPASYGVVVRGSEASRNFNIPEE